MLAILEPIVGSRSHLHDGKIGVHLDSRTLRRFPLLIRESQANFSQMNRFGHSGIRKHCRVTRIYPARPRINAIPSEVPIDVSRVSVNISRVI